MNTNVHLVGIGGVGMRGLANLLISQGVKVSGSEKNYSHGLKELELLGANVFLGHNETNITNADIVVYSTAINKDNPEMIAAHEKNIEVIHRSKMLQRISESKKVIAITGTHGKTSSTAMIAHVLKENGFDPSFAIGSSWAEFKLGSYLGSGDWFVIEADESDASMLNLCPEIGLVLNLEPEHMCFYGHSYNNLEQAFVSFMDNVVSHLIYCLDNENLARAQEKSKLDKKISYSSVNKQADVWVENKGFSGGVQNYCLHELGDISQGSTYIAGEHQLLNLAGVYLVCRKVGIDKKDFIHAMKSFQLPGRRFDELGLAFGIKNTVVIDDYGHHPHEISVTVKAVRSKYPNRRIVMLFQPHKFSRVKDNFQGFINELSVVDELILLDVYPAGEEFMPGYDSDALANQLVCHRVESLDSAFEFCKKIVKEYDIVLCQGAGDVTKLACEISGAKVV